MFIQRAMKAIRSPIRCLVGQTSAERSTRHVAAWARAQTFTKPPSELSASLLLETINLDTDEIGVSPAVQRQHLVVNEHTGTAYVAKENCHRLELRISSPDEQIGLENFEQSAAPLLRSPHHKSSAMSSNLPRASVSNQLMSSHSRGLSLILGGLPLILGV